MLETVAERDSDLLKPEELEFLEQFRDLSIDARRLYVRLLSRKGPIVRRDRIAYREVPSIDAAIDELVAVGFADRGQDATVEELLWGLLRAELLALVSELAPGQVSAQARRRQLLQTLLGEAVDVEKLRQLAWERLAPVRLQRLQPVVVFRLLFFGNLSQDWTEFVLRDLGVMRYEAYPLRRDLRLFPTRQAVDEYLWWRLAKHEVLACLDLGDTDRAVELARALLERVGELTVDRDDRRPVDAQRLADRVFNQVGQSLERRGDLRQALTFYRAAHAPPSRERSARILARLGGVAQALALCDEIGAEPRDEGEAAFARKFAHRLRRMRGEPVRAPLRRQRPTERLALPRVEGMTVERLALADLAQAGRVGFFAENWLWKSLFGLAFWDIIFAPMPGAFQHPFQLGPLDLDVPTFRARRSEAIEHRLETLREQPEPGPKLLRRYDEKLGIVNRLVSWQDSHREHLELALSRLTGCHLVHVFDRLSRDLWRYRRGLPDLFVLRDEAPGFELFEVKSPSDQLRPEQTSWIDYLNDGGLPTSILNVSWQPTESISNVAG